MFKDHKVQLVFKEKLELLVYKGHKVGKEIKVQLGFKDHKVQLAFKVKLEQPVFKDLKEFKVYKEK